MKEAENISWHRKTGGACFGQKQVTGGYGDLGCEETDAIKTNLKNYYQKNMCFEVSVSGFVTVFRDPSNSI